MESTVEGNSNEIRIILLGKKGSGKSRTGNTILGNDYAFQYGPMLFSLEASKQFTNRFEKQIAIVDTPGYDFVNNINIVENLQECLKLVTPGPNAFVVCIEMGRDINEDKMLKCYADRYGETIYKFTIVVFTHLDDWQCDMEDIGIDKSNPEEFITSLPKSAKTLLNRCGNRYCFFNNRAVGEEKKEQVKKLITQIELIRATETPNYFENVTLRKKCTKILQSFLPTGWI